MGGECEEVEKSERRKESFKFGEKLSRIEATVESIKEQMPARFEEIKEQISERFESVSSWQSDRKHECDEIREAIVKIRIEQEKQGVKIAGWTFLGSTIIAAIVAYFVRK